MKKRSQLFIFDMGGVLLDGVFELGDIMAEQGREIDLYELYRDKIMDAYSCGQVTEEEYWEVFNNLHGTNVESPRWGRSFNPLYVDQVADLIRELKLNNRVVCGSNTIEPHYNFSARRGDYQVFHKTYASHLMGVAKPAAEFWKIILEEEGYKASNVIFIDDSSDNIEAAASLCIRALHFESGGRLRNQLVELGYL